MPDDRVVWRYAAIGAALAFFAIYLFLDENKLRALYFGADNGIFLQTLANLAHHGSAFNWAERRSHWFVHDSWLIAVLAPFVALYPYQETLIVAQVALIGSAGMILYVFLRNLAASRRVAALFVLGFLVSPSAQGFAYSDFSESHFEPALIFGLALALQKRSFIWCLILAQCLLGVKEDVGIFLIWFGIAGFFLYDRKIGAAVTTLAILNVTTYYAFVYLHGYHPGAPVYGLSRFHPVPDISFLLEILVPVAFTPLRFGWRCAIVLPLVAELFFADAFPLARTGVHYTEALVALTYISAALVISRRPQLLRWTLAGSFAMALFFNPTVLHIGRTLYAPNPLYEPARVLATTTTRIVFQIEDQGIWDVLAADPNARIVGFGRQLRYQKPAWNTWNVLPRSL